MSEKTDALNDLYVIITEQYERWDDGESVAWEAIRVASEIMVDAVDKEEQDYRVRERNNEDVYDERENNISLQENDRAKATTKKFQYNLKESDRGLREEFENGDATIDVFDILNDRENFSRRDVEEDYNVKISNIAYIDTDTGDDVYYVEGDKRDLYYFLYDFVDMEHDEIYETYPGLFEGVDSADDMYE